MNNGTALANLYNASRLSPLTAEQHELLRKCYEQLAAALTPTEAKKE